MITLCLDNGPALAIPIQDQQRLCPICQLLFFDGYSRCSAGGAHVSLGSESSFLPIGHSVFNVEVGKEGNENDQGGWGRCGLC
jgi:hypothetical protein